MYAKFLTFTVVLLCFFWLATGAVRASDITNVVFGNNRDGIIAAFGDFNSDELTDVFVLKNRGQTLEVLLGSDTEPLLRSDNNIRCTYTKLEVTSVVPGDFDGDAFMDVLITAKIPGTNKLGVYINWGGSDYLNCTQETEPILVVTGEPVALDYNKDMIIDLFGLDDKNNRTFWVFNNERKKPNTSQMSHPKTDADLSIPHAHAYLDLNNDFTADLFVTTERHFEIWHGLEDEGFVYSHKIEIPTGTHHHIGQTLFLDIELKGVMNQLLPICFDQNCNNSTILVHAGNNFHDLHVDFKDPENQQWGFVVPSPDKPYVNTITLRGGDFNLDGYPDMLITLARLSGQRQPQTFLLENAPCAQCGTPLSRIFKVQWKALSPFSNGTIMGAFYDFYQDGILDVMFVEQSGDGYKQLAFRNTLDYDANFVKVIVLTGLSNHRDPTKTTPLGRKKRTYGGLRVLFL